jgi:hypothetical protein
MVRYVRYVIAAAEAAETHVTRISAALILSTFVVAASTARSQEKFEASPDAPVLGDFKKRVEKYDQLRKHADDSAPPLKESKSAAKIKDAQQGLAERIGAARVGVKQGDIFTPEIAAVFKRLLRPELKQRATKEVLKEDKPVIVSFKVNGPYPDKQPVVTMLPNVLAAVPQLPKDIEYRFIDKHLILRDSRANLIIDYIPNAIP